MSSPTESDYYLVRKNSTTVAHGFRLSRNIKGNLLSPYNYSFSCIFIRSVCIVSNQNIVGCRQ